MGKLNDETLPPVTWPKVMNHDGAFKGAMEPKQEEVPPSKASVGCMNTLDGIYLFEGFISLPEGRQFFFGTNLSLHSKITWWTKKVPCWMVNFPKSFQKAFEGSDASENLVLNFQPWKQGKHPAVKRKDYHFVVGAKRWFQRFKFCFLKHLYKTDLWKQSSLATGIIRLPMLGKLNNAKSTYV